MIADKVIKYLSHLDGVKVGAVHDSHSHYFQMTDILVRVSDHFAIKANFPTTLNIVCENDDFVVTYGNKLLPVNNYASLRTLLRNFAMVSDILAPLAETRKQVKVVERVVVKTETKQVPVEVPVVATPPSKDDPNWVFIGDLPERLKPGIRKNLENVKKMSHIK